MSNHTSLTDLEGNDEFLARHIGPSDAEVAAMLRVVGADSLDDLIRQTVPGSILLDAPLDLPAPVTERNAIARLRGIAADNTVMTSLIGMGYSDTITPAVIQRNILENPAWYTSYTPYQPEISQGRLEALLTFQTVVADLTGLPLANASLLDEGTAAAEAMTMARRASRADSPVFFVDHDCHPQTIAVVATRAEPIGIEVVVGDPEVDLPDALFGALLAVPGSSGAVRDVSPVIARVHALGGLAAVVADPLAMVLVTPPGDMGADIAVGSMQRYGVPMGFGGPHAGFIATREEFARSLPGRLVGVSLDAAGRPALRLALQTREQHIRREKATSNVCTAQALLAIIAAMYASWHGAEGLRRIAERTLRLTSIVARGLRDSGIEVVGDTWFDTLTVRVPGRSPQVLAAARAEGINLREVDNDTVGLSFDETSTPGVVVSVWRAFGITASVDALDPVVAEGIPVGLRRTRAMLQHPVFTRYRTEHEMLRYLRRLEDRDLALDRTMIPLGSCTMKLNAASEMMPITWPEFAGIHPFAPIDQTTGYRRMFDDLERALCEVTGYDAVSLQPNAGSQGELAGLLAIRGYHRERGDARRTICLIPSSAHGTNAASAVMAGMSVVVVACTPDGDVDLADLRVKADEASDRLAAVMITYPSTHGVFETDVEEICEVVHARGGQVYVDGANLNALVGLAKPGHFGADVSHLNLHKTFCIPHGGGGPGVGPVAVRAHLAPYLPNHPLRADAGPASGVGPVSAAPFGSAGILPIPWMYITLMGAEGLRQASAVAILSANYVAARLSPHFPVLHTGAGGRVAHECILDLRPIKDSCGVTVDDVAKRLMDHGFHAPTMSFPVAGTLMVEPTESEAQRELDRFCDAMISIREEIARVESGEWDVDDNPLRHAPHTAEDVATDTWGRPYGRIVAAYPLPGTKVSKYWPPVGRIDSVHGDRNLVCSCPPVEDYA
ncbi:MAG: glycine dehydrogenase (aminomethyl-transferring) [Thermoleophilia bacterium]|nr:glycine dehydrogenase (aminomethyl-transferring) [Thermoleophilia bacterium]